jgi:hypothetical protein
MPKWPLCRRRILWTESSVLREFGEAEGLRGAGGRGRGRGTGTGGRGRPARSGPVLESAMLRDAPREDGGLREARRGCSGRASARCRPATKFSPMAHRVCSQKRGGQNSSSPTGARRRSTPRRSRRGRERLEREEGRIRRVPCRTPRGEREERLPECVRGQHPQHRQHKHRGNSGPRLRQAAEEGVSKSESV